MKCNIGKTDKIVRIILGVALIVYGIVYKSWIGALGIIPLITAWSGLCLLYLPLKVNTSKKRS